MYRVSLDEKHVMNTLRSLWADSRGKVVFTLIAIWVAALAHHFRWIEVIYPVVGVITVVFLDWFITRVRTGTNIFSLSSIVTGLLIGLILDPHGGMPLLFLASVLAVFDKQFLRAYIHRHIFNPAAFGILVAAQLLQGNIAWWAVSWGIWPVIILGLMMIWVLSHIRRLFLPLTFLFMYFLINVARTGAVNSARLLLDGTVFLFAFIMLPEPMTSLARGAWQYMWGILVGALLFVLIRFPIPLIDPLLTALLLANLVGFFIQLRQSKI